MRIWKDNLLVGTNLLRWPKGAEVLTAAMQGPRLSIWFCCEDAPLITRKFYVVGTGQEFEIPRDELIYISTAQDGSFIWHVFEVGWL